MKTGFLFIALLFFVTTSGSAQTTYAVEFVGGIHYPGLGSASGPDAVNGISGGVGVSIVRNERLEFVGTTLFTYYPAPSVQPVYWYFIPNYAHPDQSRYSGDVTIGLRLHGHGSEIIHPFLVIDGGMRLLRADIASGPYVVPMPKLASRTQFLNIHGTEDMHLLGLVSLGVGVQIRPSKSLWLNLTARHQVVLGSDLTETTFIPVLLSVQLPM